VVHYIQAEVLVPVAVLDLDLAHPAAQEVESRQTHQEAVSGNSVESPLEVGKASHLEDSEVGQRSVGKEGKAYHDPLEVEDRLAFRKVEVACLSEVNE
jgi:hypothetical protein